MKGSKGFASLPVLKNEMENQRITEHKKYINY